jgi:hypothetical protein
LLGNSYEKKPPGMKPPRMITLNCILKKLDERLWIGIIWFRRFRTEACGGFLWT